MFIYYSGVSEARKVSAFIALAMILMSGCERNEAPLSSQVLARVGEKEITAAYFESQLAILPDAIQRLSAQSSGKKAILESVINREILYAEALRMNLDKNAEVERRLEYLRKDLIITKYLQEQIVSRIKIDDKEIENFYDRNPSEFKKREELRISQIVIRDATKAEEILEKLSIKRDFGDLAQQYSTDKKSSNNKGDVGYYTYSMLPEAVRDEVIKMEPGDVSRPFKIAERYEIYKITDRRTISYSLDQAKVAIRTRLFNEKVEKELKVLLDELRKKTEVQMNEALLK